LNCYAVLLVLIMLFTACGKIADPFFSTSIEIAPVDIKPFDVDKDIAHLLDSIDHKVWKYSVTYPDSAEILLCYTVDLLDSLNLPQMKFYAYMDLAQFYQYRKPNAYKTIDALGKAVRIFVDHPGSYTSNASVYIDIGNVFFRFELFDEAINLYQLAYNLSTYSENTTLQTVALQNIALAYKGLKNWDTAMYFILKAHEHIDTDMNLLMAQNNNYLAELLLLTGKDIDVDVLVENGLNLLNDHNEPVIDQHEAYRMLVYSHEISANANRILSHHYYTKGNFDLADDHLNTAILLSEQINSTFLKAKLLFARTYQYSPDSHIEALIRNADSAKHLIFSINEPVLQQAFADSMQALFKRKNLLPLQEKYAALSRSVTENTNTQIASSGVIKNIMLMASIAAEQAVQKLLVLQHVKQQTIRRQKILIFSIITVSLLILAGLIKIFMQKQKIALAHKAIVTQIKNKIEEEDNQLQNFRISAETFDHLEKSIDELMKKDKPYLKSSINLASLAAMLNTNQTYLSSYLNRKKNISFTDYINQYRVQEACRQLLLPSNSILSVDALANLSGFNSKSTFYKSFRKFTGMTPAEFQKSDQEHPAI
jgi:AraC-like DNA-binding protein